MTKAIIPFSDTESFEVAFPKEAIDGLRGRLLDQQYSLGQIDKGWNRDELKQTVYTALITQNVAAIAKEVATQYLYKHQGGTKGIPQDNQQTVIQADGLGLTEKQKEALEEYRSRMQLNEVAN